VVGVALMFTGAIFLVNGMALIGRVSGPSVAIFNLVAFVLDAGIGIWSGLTGNPFGMGQLLLFAFTYLVMAWNVLTGEADWRAFGWYCGFVAVMAVPTSLNLYSSGAPWFGSFWMSWAVLWYLFFLMFGLGLRLPEKLVGASAIAIGIGTVMVPGYLLTSGAWAGG
jgi:hypothetical protein